MAGLGKIWALSFQQQHAGATHLLKLLSRTDAHEELLTLLGATTAALRDDVVRAEMLCRQWLELHARENPMMKASALACLASIVASQSNAAEFAALRPLLDQACALADQGFARDWAKIAEVLLLLTQGQIIPARNRIDAHLTDMVSGRRADAENIAPRCAGRKRRASGRTGMAVAFLRPDRRRPHSYGTGHITGRSSGRRCGPLRKNPDRTGRESRTRPHAATATHGRYPDCGT